MAIGAMLEVGGWRMFAVYYVDTTSLLTFDALRWVVTGKSSMDGEGGAKICRSRAMQQPTQRQAVTT